MFATEIWQCLVARDDILNISVVQVYFWIINHEQDIQNFTELIPEELESHVFCAQNT